MDIEKSKPTIGYVMGFMGISGGNKIIYEHANRLADKGLEVYLLHLNDGKDRGWFNINPKVKIAQFQDTEVWIDKVDMVIATFNETFWNIIDLPSHIKKAYFVQSDERRFYEKGSLGEYLSNATYTFKNVYYYTEAKWMQKWLKDEFGINAPIFRNKIDPKDFYPEKSEKLKSNKSVVLVEGNAHMPTKGVQDAAEALKGTDYEKWLLTNSQDPLPEYTKVFDRIFSRPPQDEIRQIYSSADILVKPSYFEGSPLPHMEAMACGTGIITTDCTGVDEYCIHLENSYIVPVGNINEIRKAVELLINDENLLEKLKKNGLKLAKEVFYDWDSVIKKEIGFFSTFAALPNQEVYTPQTLTRYAFESTYFIKEKDLHKRLHVVESSLSSIKRKFGLITWPYKLGKGIVAKKK